MKIKRFDIGHLHNAEHFQFHANILAILDEANPATAKLEAQIAALRTSFADEDKIMKPIEKSAVTKLIVAADAARDETFRSLMATYRAAAVHLSAAVREAAAELEPLFDAYRRITVKSFVAQSAKTDNFIQTLRTKYAGEVTTLNLGPWLDELDRQNKAVEELMNQRNIEKASRRSYETVEGVRRRVDEAWRNLAMCIQALAIMETGDTAAAIVAMIARINVTVEHYATAMAVRRGRAAAAKQKEYERSEVKIEN